MTENVNRIFPDVAQREGAKEIPLCEKNDQNVYEVWW